MTLDPSAGGKARAKSLTSSERSEIARAAAEARWEKEGKSPIPVATYGSPDRPLRIGEIEIPCYVLDDETRVLAQRGVVGGLGMKYGSSRTGADRLARFFEGARISPFVPAELRVLLTNPIKFKSSGGITFGYPASMLADICEVVLAARRAGVLQKQQEHIAHRCEILVRAFAKVGIIALVDEATGYQDLRARNALAVILEEFIAEELRKWVRTFPPDFYKQMFRLRGWAYDPGSVKRPQLVGKLTDNIVYRRLAPGVREELRKLNPRDERGRRRHKHHQWLSEDAGHPKLIEHLGSVTTIMKLSKTWDEFTELLNRIHKKYDDGPWLPMDGL